MLLKSASTSLLIVFSISLSLSGQEFDQPAADHKEKSKHENALVKETSPYLLMHAHNPVNWYGWGEEALTLAKTENKPIFLSIGYSSCHWCHVMERESFLDEEIAKFLNDNFICIKVDREERPDVDEIYMESLRIVNRRTSGGWPLSMFLTPEAKPFFGGTYFPARDGERGVRFGFLTIVSRVHEAWNNNNAKIKEDADFVVNQVKKRLAGQSENLNTTIDPKWIENCTLRLKSSFDAEFGGFNYAPHDPNRPKFPEPSILLYLLEQVKNNSADSETKNQFVKTCERMMMGGILDHLGGGFHRYSVDRFWKIPHFEKMLYDNAQLASVYSEAYELTKRNDFKWVAEELVEFVLREMQDKDGAFYSALDAESEGEEGKFYRWNKEEVTTALSAEEFELFAKVYGLNKGPNFESKFYVPQLDSSFPAIAKRLGMDEVKLFEQLKPIRNKLFDVRSKRIRPLTDIKILASWNGMMIRGLADTGRILKNETYIDSAKSAARFVLKKMVTEKGRLFRTHTDNKASLNAYVPDYACVIEGLLSLHRATQEKEWLDAAVKLQTVQDELFWDEKQGGYFYTSNDHESLLARAKRSNDGPVPSGNSVSVANLTYLAKALSNRDYQDRAKKAVLSASELLNQFPSAAPRLLIPVEAMLEKVSETTDGKSD